MITLVIFLLVLCFSLAFSIIRENERLVKFVEEQRRNILYDNAYDMAGGIYEMVDTHYGESKDLKYKINISVILLMKAMPEISEIEACSIFYSILQSKDDEE